MREREGLQDLQRSRLWHVSYEVSGEMSRLESLLPSAHVSTRHLQCARQCSRFTKYICELRDPCMFQTCRERQAKSPHKKGVYFVVMRRWERAV